MEGDAPLSRFQGQRSSHGVHVSDPRTSQPSYSAKAGGSTGDAITACTIREQDRLMPVANVIRIMRKVLPTHAMISDEAKETMQECTSEFISFVTSKANERCQREQRKTVTVEDILWAMSRLGFDNYVRLLTAYLYRYRELAGDHRGSLRGDSLALPIRRAPPSEHNMFILRPLPQLSFYLPPLLAPQQQQLMGYYTYGRDGSGSESRRGMDGAGAWNGPMRGFNSYGPYK